MLVIFNLAILAKIRQIAKLKRSPNFPVIRYEPYWVHMILPFTALVNLYDFTTWALISQADGILSWSEFAPEDVKSNVVNLVSNCSSSSRHSRVRHTDSMSLLREKRVWELGESCLGLVIRRRKDSFLDKHLASICCWRVHCNHSGSVGIPFRGSMAKKFRGKRGYSFDLFGVWEL